MVIMSVVELMWQNIKLLYTIHVMPVAVRTASWWQVASPRWPLPLPSESRCPPSVLTLPDTWPLCAPKNNGSKRKTHHTAVSFPASPPKYPSYQAQGRLSHIQRGLNDWRTPHHTHTPHTPQHGRQSPTSLAPDWLLRGPHLYTQMARWNIRIPGSRIN